MKLPAPEIERLTIFLAGAFNPSILQPAWFASEKLLRKSEADAAQNLTVTGEYTTFALDWMAIEARVDQISVFTEDPSSNEAVRDLVVGIFRLLSHTPIEVVSVISQAHFKAESIDSWHLVGNTLAPKNVYEGLLEKPGLMDLRLQAVRTDGRKGEVMVVAQPSRRITPGVFLAVSDDYRLSKADEAQEVAGTGLLDDILTNDWSSSMDRRRHIINTILERI
ncbi:MAG: hypothetical protein INR62_02040 [Rhodospirillales bacterium]|nr:hypothetical protein [Acetobacter sp.]